jgi:hypothetical protein
MESLELSSNDPPMRVSGIFNAQFGDLALQSSDGTFFYVPRALLQLSSKPFATAIEAEATAGSNTAIQVQTTSDALELLLTFIHPGVPNPIIHDLPTLTELVRIAKQYEMEFVISSLRACFLNNRPGKRSTEEQPLVKAEPLASLAVAYSFELHDVARAALRELVKQDLGAQLRAARGHDIPLSLVEVIFKLREDRVRWYRDKLLWLCDIVANQIYSSSMRQNREDFIAWKAESLEAISAGPNLETLKARHALAIHLRLTHVTNTWSQMCSWEIEALKMESTLPDLGPLA